MHFRVRVFQNNQYNDLMLNLPRSSTIGDLNKLLEEKYNIPVTEQTLIFGGRYLTSYVSLLDCKVNYNDVIQLKIRNDPETEKPRASSKTAELPETLIEAKHLYYKTGDLVEVCDHDFGAWWDAKITQILTKPCDYQIENYVFRVHYDWNIPSVTNDYKPEEVRPRSNYTYKKRELKKGMLVLANYNLEEPWKRGYWYNFKIEKLGRRTITGSVLVGLSQNRIQNKSIKYAKEIMRIEEPTLLTERDGDNTCIPSKPLPFYCDACKDAGNLCFICGCVICGGKQDESSILLCDECDDGYHIKCLNPPLLKVPSELEWFCPECKNPDVTIATVTPRRDSNSKKLKKKHHSDGMNCVGRTRVCTIVPINHFGSVPGVEVGTCWKFRIQVSEAGVHRPIMAGIHGSVKEGAFSLVLSGGYEDDEDNGDEFLYTGSGGRNASKERRTGKQCCNQQLTYANKALALNCDAKFNDKHGAKAKDWRAGKPVRVVRSYKARKHSKFAPEDGNRYDGIYKVVEYVPKIGKSGFLVWTFTLRRDDPVPAPWATGGQELPIIYPLGYLEAHYPPDLRDIHKLERKRKLKNKAMKGRGKAQQSKKQAKYRADLSLKINTKRKHSFQASDSETGEDNDEVKLSTYKQKFFGGRSSKKICKSNSNAYSLNNETQRAIKADKVNSKIWDECLKYMDSGKVQFFEQLQEHFMCVCCQDLLFQPVTVFCGHNVCQECLARSFKADIYTCPYCRKYVREKRKLKVNSNLQNALSLLFKGYEQYRK